MFEAPGGLTSLSLIETVLSRTNLKLMISRRFFVTIKGFDNFDMPYGYL